MGTGPLQEHPADFLGHIIKALGLYGFSKTNPGASFCFPTQTICHPFVGRADNSTHRTEAEASVVASSQITKG